MDERRHETNIQGDVHGFVQGDHTNVTIINQGRIEQPLSKQERQNRLRLIAKVRSSWIKGVLEQSLQGAALIALGLEERSDVLANPWRLVLQEPDRTIQPLPEGTRIIQVYDDANGELLILGEPGCGKTTLLLEVARDLLDRAEQNVDLPIPVVFNLSSWVVKRQPLAEWLVDELNTKYQVPRKLGQGWVDNDHILPLLDGLDEVALEHRAMCVNAVNVFRLQHGMVSTVVCSRKAEYLDLTTRVLLQSAVVVQPLTVEQIDEYLSSAGEHLETLRVLLHEDQALYELAMTPLMLSVMTLAFTGRHIEDLGPASSLETRRQYILTQYVERMLERRPGQKARYKDEQIKHWLTSLAQRLLEHNQGEFYLERLQPGWLPTPRLRKCYHTIVNGLTGALIGALSGGITGGLVGGLIVAPIVGKPGRQFDELLGVLLVGASVGLLIGLFAGLIIGLLVSRNKNIEIHPTEILVWSWQNTHQHLTRSLGIGFVAGLSFWPLSDLFVHFIGLPIGNLVPWLVYELAGGLVGGILSALIFIRIHKIQLNRPGILQNPRLRRFVRNGVLVGFIVGLMEAALDGKIGGTTGMLFAQPDYRVFTTPLGRLGIGLVSGSLSALAFGVSNGFTSEKMDKEEIVLPNQGIRRSLRNGVLVGLLCSVSFFIIFVLTSNLTFKWLYGVIFGILLGLIFGLLNGGIACIQHTVLRLSLWWVGAMPLNYARFLDYAAERILLRKVGGGYIFIHRVLLEHFATPKTGMMVLEI